VRRLEVNRDKSPDIEKDYLVITVSDITNVLTARPHHLIKYLASSGNGVTVVYRTSGFHGIRSDERKNLRYLGFPFPSFFYLFAPLCGIWLFLALLFTDKFRYKAGIALGVWSGFTCQLLKKTGRIKTYVYEDTDYVPGNHKNPVIRKIVHLTEAWCIRKADLTVSTGELLAKLRKKQGARRVIVVPNGVIIELFKRAREKMPHPPTMIYVGYLDEKFGVDLPVRALPAIIKRIPDVRFLIIGDGPFRRELERLVRNLQLERNVIIVGKVSHKEVPAFLSQADVGIATFKKTELMVFAFPLKIVEYAAAGLPVIGTKVGEIELLIRKYEIGEVIDYSIEEFVSSFADMLLNKDKHRFYSENSCVFSESYDWNLLFRKEISAINSFQNNHAG